MPPETKIKTVALVELTIEVTCDTNWVASASLEQVFSQATAGARGAVRDLLSTNPAIRLTGDEPKVRIVTTTKETK